MLVERLTCDDPLSTSSSLPDSMVASGAGACANAAGGACSAGAGAGAGSSAGIAEFLLDLGVPPLLSSCTLASSCEKNVSWIRKRRNKVKQKGISRQIVEQAVLGSRKKLEEVVRSGQK